MDMIQARQVFVSGKVQGVGFRNYILKKAKVVEVTGWVRNLPDGRVEARIQGRHEQINEMLVYLERGPVSSEVLGVESTPVDPEESLVLFAVR